MYKQSILHILLTDGMVKMPNKMLVAYDLRLVTSLTDVRKDFLYLTHVKEFRLDNGPLHDV